MSADVATITMSCGCGARFAASYPRIHSYLVARERKAFDETHAPCRERKALGLPPLIEQGTPLRPATTGVVQT